MKEQRTIDIDHLIADGENPRFEAVSTEEDALFSILEDQSLASGNKILNLARDIAAHGLNASELLIVSPIGGTDDYRVREGNRRVTAIKLSLHSDKVPEGFSTLAPYFKELGETMQKHRRIECYVCDDEDEIRRLLVLRHGGENGGVGTVKWNSVQTSRFSEGGNQQTARALSLIEHLKEDYGQGELWRAAAIIPATNLGRLISTPEVRQALGISADGNDARYLGGHDELLLDVLGQVKNGGVGPIYNKEARVQLVEEAAQRVEPEGSKQGRLPFEHAEPDRCGDSPTEAVKEQAADLDHRHVSATNGEDDNILSSPHINVLGQPQEDATSETATGASGGSSNLEPDDETTNDTDATGTVRRKPVSRAGDNGMFGCVLRPKGTKSNDLYRAIDWIDQQYLGNPGGYSHLLPILGFSLRLLLETVAREYYEAQGKEAGQNAFNSFMKDVAKPAIKKKLDATDKSYMALASEWIDGDVPFDALFHKWAHGVIPVERASLVRQSELVALIIQELWSDGGGRQ